MMNFKEYLENELGVDFQELGVTQPMRTMSNSEVMDFCNYYSIYPYNEQDLRREFASDWADEFLLGFVDDFKSLAEACNFKMVNKDLYIDNLAVHDFKQTLENEYNYNINLMINEWKSNINGSDVKTK